MFSQQNDVILDDVQEITRDRSVDIFCITELWHDTDSACIGRLRSAGYNVVDRPRPRGDDALSVVCQSRRSCLSSSQQQTSA